MSTENRAKAAAQNVEGKIQEVTGAVTGDSQDEAMGKAKQAVAKARSGIEDVKDNIADKAMDVADKLQEGVQHAKDRLKK